MFNLNLTEVRKTVTVKPDGRVTVDYFFDFADGGYGMLSSVSAGQTATFRHAPVR